MTIDWQRGDSALGRALEELTELLVAEEPLSTVLARVIELACTGIDGCDLGSITWMTDEVFETVAYSDPIALEIDQAQYDADRGPCLFAFRRREAVSVPSMDEGDSWPQFRAAASERDVRSSFSLPMATGDVRVGALNLYGRTDHAFNSVPPEAAVLFAKEAAAAIWGARALARTRRLIEHLETALETREVIGAAKGIIMANERLHPEEAFSVLVRASQRQNVRLRKIAEITVETGATPG
jgi:GAF domain-containing protein